MLAACAVSGFIGFSQVSFAQNAIAPDKTLPVNTVVNFNDANKTYTITGGTQAGVNQFHSFQDLSVPTANTAHFDNALTTANVIGRVTGSNISNIDGTLKTNGSTNLYLINPNGIIYGANAKLDIGGSFSASTANSIKFSDGSEFSATNPQAPPLIQVTMPLGLQYGKSSPAPVSNAGNLSVGKDLTLSGGSVTSTGSLSAPKGNLRLEAIAGDVTAKQLQAGRALQVMSVGNVTLDAIAITGNGTNNDNNSKVPLSDGSFLAVDMATRPVVDIRAGVLPSAFFSAPAVAANTLTGANISIGSITFDDTLKTANGLIFLTNQFAQNGNLTGDISVGAISTYNFEGNAGSVAIDSKGGINVAAPIYAYSDNANGGAVNLLANGDITVAGIYTISNSYDYSIGGNISLLSRNGNIDTTQGDILAYSYFYDAGKVTLKAGQDASIGNISTESGSYGVANDIEVNARSVSMSSSTLSSGAYGYGNAGNITINATDKVSLSNGSRIYSRVENGAVGNGGNIIINANSVSIADLSSLSVSALGNGNAGSVVIDSNGSIDLATSIKAYSNYGNGGEVNLLANGNITVTGIDTSSLFGLGGNVTLISGQDILSGNVDTSSTSSKAGNISLLSHNGNIDTSNGVVNASSLLGVGGDVTLTAGQDILAGSIDTSSLDSNAGSISINASSIAVTDGAYLFSGTFGQGNAGNASITATESVLFDNGRIYTGSSGNAIGNEGYVSINGHSVSFTNGSRISTNPLFSLQGQNANSGNISINAINSVSFDNSSISSETVFGFGNGGLVNIHAHSVSFKNSSGLSSSTFGLGNSGDISITATDSVSFDNFSSAFSEVFSGAVGRGGNVNIKARSVSFTNSSGLSSSTLGIGDSGAISIAATDSVLFDSSFASSDVLYGAVGNGGKVNVNARSVSSINGSELTSRTFGLGNAGNIDVSAQTLDIQNGATISTSTSSSGNAGLINILLTRSLNLDGQNTLISAQTAETSSGKGGSIFIDPPLVSITNGAGISVNSLGTGNGGNIDIFAGKFIFANNAFISATTASGEGGNINLQIADIFFPRNQSSINATAGNNGNGGNINLSALFLVSIPSENNDIFANASFGKGGNINITTQNIFGLASRSSPTTLSDITASSEFGVQGTISINTPGVDPSKGLSNLSVNVSDPSRLVKERCIADRRGSSFTITGKGGVPANPSDRPTDTGVFDNFGASPDRHQTTNLTSSATPQPTTTPDAIVEATNWIVNAQNQVVLVAGKTPSQPNIRCLR
jgi:filamentous hemagglutinin family protein